MQGKNEITRAFRNEDGSLLVNDVFYTIQGEGPDAGEVAVFVRLAKCNLRCFFCDTEFETGSMVNPDILADRIKKIAGKVCKLVVITGGEPLLQNICPLVARLNSMNMRVSVETAGTTSYSDLYHYFAVERDRARWQSNRIIVSPKTPNLSKGISDLAYAWKYIIRKGAVCPDDGLPIEGTQVDGELKRIARPVRPPFHLPRVYIQPMDEGDEAKNKYNRELAAKICMFYGYKLSLQMHKIVGVP